MPNEQLGSVMKHSSLQLTSSAEQVACPASDRERDADDSFGDANKQSRGGGPLCGGKRIRVLVDVYVGPESEDGVTVDRRHTVD